MSLYYLAYGSNLHPGRLQDRVASAALLGTVEMHGWSLGFDKRSVDGSAKCNLAPGGAADIAHAAVFSLHRNDRSALDRAEGLGAGYLEARLTLELGGRELQAFYYVADPDYLITRLRPFHWYRALVMAGARFHEFPDRYLALLGRVQSVEDPDTDRRIANERLLERCLELGDERGASRPPHGILRRQETLRTDEQ